MPPKGSKKSPLSAEQAKESGLSLMTRFFRHLLHKKTLHNLRAFSVVLYVKEKINRIPLRIAPRRRKNTHIIYSIECSEYYHVRIFTIDSIRYMDEYRRLMGAAVAPKRTKRPHSFMRQILT